MNQKLKLYTYNHLEEYILIKHPRSSITHNRIIDTITKLMDDTGVFSLDSEKYTDMKTLLYHIFDKNDKTEWWFELILRANKRYWCNHNLKLPHNPDWRKCMDDAFEAESQLLDCCKSNKLFSNDKTVQSILNEVILNISECIAVNKQDYIKIYKKLL